jgi:hypothetical protein
LNLLDLGLRRTTQNEEGEDRCTKETRKHDVLTGNFSRSTAD